MSESFEQQLMTVQEVAARLHASQSFVYGLISAGELKHYRLGRAGLRVSMQQLIEYLEGKERGGTTDPAPRLRDITFSGKPS